MYTNNRDAYRQFFFMAFDKYKKNLPLDLTEARLVEIIHQHPEYHPLLEKPDGLPQEFAPEENPFIHLSLHLALREQIACNRPAGIGFVQQQLNARVGNEHQVEHLMMECLCKMMGLAQETGSAPDDEAYLEALRGI